MPAIGDLKMRWSQPFHLEVYNPASVSDIVERVGSGNGQSQENPKNRLRSIR